MKDAVWDSANKTLFKFPDLSDYQPWTQVVRVKRTCTADMCLAQDVQQENQETPIDRKDIAQALHKRNIFRDKQKLSKSHQMEGSAP